jgi:hypothetical protein
MIPCWLDFPKFSPPPETLLRVKIEVRPGRIVVDEVRYSPERKWFYDSFGFVFAPADVRAFIVLPPVPTR